MKTRLALVILLLGLSSVVLTPGTSAWLSDLEDSGGHLSCESVNIAVDGQDVWTRSYHIRRPGNDTRSSSAGGGITSLPVENLGAGPVDVWKRIAAVQDYGDLDPGRVEYGLKLDNRWLIPESRALPVTTVCDRWIYLGRLDPGQVVRVRQTFRLENRVGERSNPPNGGFSFDDQFFAIQADGPAGPVPVLPGCER